MKEGRIRPSFCNLMLEWVSLETAAMKEGRIRPSFTLPSSPRPNRVRPQ